MLFQEVTQFIDVFSFDAL